MACGDRTLFGLAAENVGYLQNWPPSMDLAKRFVEAWMSSPEHRRNILSTYQALEVGCRGDRSIMYCTPLFARSIHYLEQPVARRLSPGRRVTFSLGRRSFGEADGGWRLSLARHDGGGRHSTVPFQREDASGEGALVASMAMPETEGWYRLNLWIPDPGEPGRFRVIGGPHLRVGSGTPARRNDPCAPDA